MRKSDRFRILARDQFRCRYCGRAAPSVELAVDHQRPRSLGGSDHQSNLVTACVACNLGKGARLLPDYSDRERADMRTWGFTVAWFDDAFRGMGDDSQREIGDLEGYWFDHMHEVPAWVLSRLIKKTREWCLSTPHPRPKASDYFGAAVERFLETGEE